MNIAARSIATKIKRLFSYANLAEYLTPAFMREVLVNDIPKNFLTYNTLLKGAYAVGVPIWAFCYGDDSTINCLLVT